MILVVAIAALVFGHATAQSHLLGQVESMVGPEGSTAVKGMIEQAQEPQSGAFASVAGLITLLLGASGVFGELRSPLNTMWDVKPANQSGLWRVLKQRFFSFGMVLAVGFLLLVSLVVSAVLAAAGKYLGGLLPLPEVVLSALNFLISWAGTVVLFALIMRHVPERRVAWNVIWIGAAATGVLFTIGKFLIGLYLGKAAVGSAYGAAASLVVLIVWVYYSAVIFRFGAEFTHVLESHQESPSARDALIGRTTKHSS